MSAAATVRAGGGGAARASSGTPAAPAAHTGRRPGDSGARAAILAAARTEFAAAGYDGATIRGIAARAGVDPALVHHYFGAKEHLFEAAVRLPMSPALLVPELLEADREHIGEQVVLRFLGAWEEPANRPVLLAVLRSAVCNEQAAELARRFLVKEVFAPLARALGEPDAELRATLVGSQFIGLALMRYVGKVEPLASADVASLAAAIGPTVQRYLSGPVSF
jgi:AcrR family transcriptional regulator